MTVATLFKPPPAVPVNLTPDQQTAWDLITRTPGGAYADEIGAAIHASRTDHRHHSFDQRCETCAERGIAVTKTRALKRLLIRRRGSGKYEAREARYRAAEPSSQLAELPGTRFEDLFA